MTMTSYCIAVPLVLHSWSPWTLLYSYGADYTGRWFDNDLMLSTAADHGFWIPELSPIPMIILNDAWTMFYYYCRSWTLYTGLVNYADHCYTMSWWCPRRRRYWCCFPSPFRPATSLSSWCWFALFVRQSSFVLMNINYTDDGSLVSSP